MSNVLDIIKTVAIYAVCILAAFAVLCIVGTIIFIGASVLAILLALFVVALITFSVFLLLKDFITSKLFKNNDVIVVKAELLE